MWYPLTLLTLSQSSNSVVYFEFTTTGVNHSIPTQDWYPTDCSLQYFESSISVEKLIDRAINTSIVLAAGSFAVTKLLTIDHEYWHGWTLFEILRYAPQHSWSAYEEALKTNPVLAKMMISGIVYSVGDWIAQF